MSPGTVFMLSIFVPAFMLVLLIGPLYAGAYFGLVFIYGQEVSETALNPDTQFLYYQSFIQHWQNHEVDFWAFTLPAFGPIIAGMLTGIFFFILFIRYLRNIFMLS